MKFICNNPDCETPCILTISEDYFNICEPESCPFDGSLDSMWKEYVDERQGDTGSIGNANELEPCPFCGVSVHWDDSMGIIHDRVVHNCIVDMVWPMESNKNLPKGMWIRKWNMRVRKADLKPCPFCGGAVRCKRYHPNDEVDTYTVGCESCGFWMYPEFWNDSWTEEQAVAVWNKRVEE